MPEKALAREICHILQENGHEAYFVGGCVRDSLLDLEPKDYDVATSAKPDEVLALFERSKPVGAHFGVVLVKNGKAAVEVATFREENTYTDGRRPEHVHFCDALADSARRDFSINAIYFDPIHMVYFDPQNGKQDLKRGLLRFIGDAKERVNEDYLRILRAVRFKNRFGLTYEGKTKEALAEHAMLVQEMAVERVFFELQKMILHKKRHEAFLDLYEMGILEVLLPELTDLVSVLQPKDHHSEGNALNHSLLTLKMVRPGVNAPVFWAAALHDIGKIRTASFEKGRWRYPDHAQVGADLFLGIAKRLRFPKGLKKAVFWLIRHHHVFDDWEKMSFKRKMYYLGHNLFDELLELHRADVLGSFPEDFDDRIPLLAKIDHIFAEYYDLKAKKMLPQDRSFLDGHDVMRILEIKAGKDVKKALLALKEAQIKSIITNKNEAEAFLLTNSVLFVE